MDCLIWELLRSDCTDIPNIHAFELELIAGVVIAVGIFFLQERNRRKRRKHALSEITYQLFKLDKNRVELHNLINQYTKLDYSFLNKVLNDDSKSMKTKEEIIKEIKENKMQLKESVSNFKTNLILFSQDLPSEEVSFLDTISNELLISFNLDESEKERTKKLVSLDFLFSLALHELMVHDKNAVNRASERWNKTQEVLKKAKTKEVSFAPEDFDDKKRDI